MKCLKQCNLGLSCVNANFCCLSGVKGSRREGMGRAGMGREEKGSMEWEFALSYIECHATRLLNFENI